ncbi:MAG: DUF4136 domain-containing protein [Gemmatimonadota bacterium]|nr:MAG: DUF4136 domain-containing protein [Gemmatimonadota bacterium]
MRSPVLSLSLAAMLALAGCSTMKVQSEFADDVSFAGLTTFAWVSPDDSAVSESRISPRARNRIVAAVERELEAKGYRPASAGTPDFLIGYYAASRYDVEVTQVYDYWRYGGGYNVYQDTRELRRGVLMLGVVDPARKEVVWRGWASDVVNDPEPAKVDAKIDEAVNKILADFPPKG